VKISIIFDNQFSVIRLTHTSHMANNKLQLGHKNLSVDSDEALKAETGVFSTSEKIFSFFFLNFTFIQKISLIHKILTSIHSLSTPDLIKT